MRDHPIIFSAPMVLALLAGRKTQTRRLAWREPIYRIGASPWQRVQPGDRLWVREAFTTTQHGKAVYRADAGDQTGARWTSIQPGDPEKEVLWRPSIHMPRWASRLTLNVTEVRVQRLHDMDNNNALHEGTPDLRTMENGWDLRTCFAHLWNSLHGPDAWAANPEVVALTFTVAQRNIDAHA